MKFLSRIYFFLISVVFATFFFFFIEENSLSTEAIPSLWAEPEVLYVLPDSVDGNRFLSARIDNGEIILLSNSIKRTADLHALEFSYVVQTRISENGTKSEEILSDVNYLAEGPALLHRSDTGEWHALWGERREDPDFEKWETAQPPINLFSTSLIYRSGGIDETGNPVDIFSAGLLPDGGGAIRPPRFSVRIDERDNLHVVFNAWMFHERSGGILPFITYLRKINDQSWEKARFPIVNEDGFPKGVDGVFETYAGDRLITAFFGAAPGEQQGINDVMIATSDDSGDSWNEPRVIYISGIQHNAQVVRIYKDKENRLHLLWGRQIAGALGVEEMWHVFSNDGGDTWTEPERFFVMERPEGVSMNGILEYDLVSDNSGCIHWSARTFEFHSGNSGGTQQGSPGLYSCWCSADHQWRHPESIDFIRNLSFTAAVDEEEEMLYLYWTDDAESGNRKAVYYSKKSLADPEPPPVISQSGPLLLHANYPNPFNPSTRVPFTLEQPGEVEISVYDMAGRRVLQQHLGAKPAGLHVHEINMEGMTSGAYIYEVSMNGTWRRQGTMMFVKLGAGFR